MLITIKHPPVLNWIRTDWANVTLDPYFSVACRGCGGHSLPPNTSSAVTWCQRLWHDILETKSIEIAAQGELRILTPEFAKPSTQ